MFQHYSPNALRSNIAASIRQANTLRKCGLRREAHHAIAAAKAQRAALLRGRGA